jgi:hypothetical protein
VDLSIAVACAHSETQKSMQVGLIRVHGQHNCSCTGDRLQGKTVLPVCLSHFSLLLPIIPQLIELILSPNDEAPDPSHQSEENLFVYSNNF